jgi:hypothetical protein
MSVNLNDGEAFVGGRSKETAQRLLALADEKGIDQREVRATTGGYIVPEALAETPKKAAAKKAPADEKPADDEAADEAPAADEAEEKPADEADDSTAKVQSTTPAARRTTKSKES